MPIDTSMYSGGASALSSGLSEGIRLGSMYKRAKDDRTVKDIYKKNLTENPDGSTQLNRATYLSDLGKAGFADKAKEESQQFTQMDMDALKAKHAQLEDIASLSSMATDQASYDKVLAEAKKRGHDVSQLPPQYSPDTMKMIQGAALTQMQRAELKLKEQEMQQRALDRQESRNERRFLAGFKPTPAQSAVDSSFGKEYADFYAGGGKATVEKNIGELQGAIDDLGKNTDLTGGASTKIPGLASDFAQDVINPKMAEVRDRIRGAVQGSLRQVLGPQFTKEEGEAIFNRAFNPRLSAEENVRRASTVLNEIKSMAAAKDQAARYYEQNGTLKGFKATNDSQRLAKEPAREPDVEQYAKAHGISYEQAARVKASRTANVGQR